jgi:hypothetical protein
VITSIPELLWLSRQLLMGSLLGLSEKYDEGMLKEYPEAVVEEHKKISEILVSLQRYFGSHLRLEIVDARSPKGVWYSVKFGVRKYPCFFVDGKVKFEGFPDLEEIRKAIFNRIEF